MATTTFFSKYLAGDKAAFSKQRDAFLAATDPQSKQIAASKMAAVLNRAPEKGFTREQVTAGQEIPNDVLALIVEDDDNVESLALTGNEAKEVFEAKKTKFGLERDLQRELRANIGQIDPNLRIIDGGKEQILSSGRTDIMAVDQRGAKVVLELKAGQADLDAIGQILSYMGAATDVLSDQPMRGIIVAGEFTPRLISAARVTPNIRLLKYSVQFTFEAVGATG